MQIVTACHLDGRITAKFVLPFTNKFTDMKYFALRKITNVLLLKMVYLVEVDTIPRTLSHELGS